jgi:hypothetical protein
VSPRWSSWHGRVFVCNQDLEFSAARQHHITMYINVIRIARQHCILCCGAVILRFDTRSPFCDRMTKQPLIGVSRIG